MSRITLVHDILTHFVGFSRPKIHLHLFHDIFADRILVIDIHILQDILQRNGNIMVFNRQSTIFWNIMYYVKSLLTNI